MPPSPKGSVTSQHLARLGTLPVQKSSCMSLRTEVSDFSRIPTWDLLHLAKSYISALSLLKFLDASVLELDDYSKVIEVCRFSPLIPASLFPMSIAMPIFLSATSIRRLDTGVVVRNTPLQERKTTSDFV